ncbi:MAG: tetratricopeptide repeat protein [Bacteroidia bacterium]|nr:tetratricopeptide repeat protein [Bacteroidia bacterium]
MKKFRLNRVLLLILCVSIHNFLFAQGKVDPEFNFQVENIIDQRLIKYSELEDLFKDDINDTLKMQFFAQKSQKENYLEGEAFARTKLGIIYREIAQYNRAIAEHLNAYNLAISSTNIELQVINLNMLGVVNRRTANYTRAIEYHQDALKIAESQNELSEGLKKGVAVSYNSIGNIYLELNNPDKALENFNRSLSIEEEMGNKLGLAMNYHNIGYALEEQSKIEAALDYYQRSLQFNEEISSLLGKLICNNSIAQIYLKTERSEQASKILENNLKLAIEIRNPYYITSTYIGLGWALYDLGLYDKAEFNLQKALQISEENNLPSFVAASNIHLSKLYEKKGDYKSAFEKYLISDKITHEIRSEENKQYVNMLDKQYETEKKNNAIQKLEKENALKDLQIEENLRYQIIGLFVILILAGIFFIYSRQRRLKNEKKIITLEQDMLRSQMNPHFIFNSLNSIKLYIINNEKENAVYYLNKFSKLIRKILMASKEKEITLAEELETMDLYMNIENIRFSNEINYKTTISSNVDLDAIKVPSLILQPFLENALWHGLSSKIEDKTINLDITKENGSFIVITITDNGIGRKEAQRIKRNKLLKRKSVGLAITNERLANFYKEHDKDFNVEIKDLYDDNGNALGTKVIITIPMEKEYKLRTA